MRRQTDYKPERGREFTWTQWNYLNEAFGKLESRDDYRNPSFGVPFGKRSFFICRKDDRPLVNSEINMLAWFFTGVIASPGFPSEED